MLKLLVMGLAAGIGIQAWRNFPADGPVTANGAALVAVLGMLGAYAVGRGRRARYGATATATATAEATAEASARADQRLAVFINNHPNAGAHPVGVQFPDEDTTSWLARAEPRRELSADELDGMDLLELLPDEQQERENTT